MLRAEEAGKEEKKKFIEERLMEKKDIFDPIHQLKLKTMAETSKKGKLRSKNNKVTEFKQQSNVAFQLLVKSQQGNIDVDLQELMSFQLTAVPYSLGTSDGFLVKTDKSSSFHLLTKGIQDAVSPPEANTLTIIDGNALFHAMVQVPLTFRDICIKVLDMLPKKTDVIFSTDMYKEGSIKAMERKRRGTGEKIILAGEATKRPGDWATFLSNDENKTQFIKLLLQVWSSDSQAAKLQDRSVVLICEGKAVKLTSPDGIMTVSEPLHDIDSTQEETYSRIALYCAYGKQLGYRFIKVKSPDTDVFFILSHFVKDIDDITILFDTGKGNYKRLIDISLLTKDTTKAHQSALHSLHAFTGCDTVSAFKGRGKLKPLKILQQTPRFVDTLARLGEKWVVDDSLLDELDALTCAIYTAEK